MQPGNHRGFRDKNLSTHTQAKYTALPVYLGDTQDNTRLTSISPKFCEYFYSLVRKKEKNKYTNKPKQPVIFSSSGRKPKN